MLAKVFIKDYESITNSSVRNKYGKLAGIFGVISNLLLGIIKLVIGILSKSVSIMADSVNNITDSFSSILTIIGFSLVDKKPTKHHPYGYARYEYICGFVISLFMLLTGALFFKESIVKVFKKEEIIITNLTLIILVIGILIKFIQMKIYLYFAKKIDSDTLKTSSVDTRNDIISSTGILLSMIIMKYFNINIDGFVGLIVSFIMIYSSSKMIKEVIDPIIGLMPDEEYVNEIKNKLLSYEFVVGIHDLVVHNYGVNNDFVTVHVEVDSRMDMITAHDLIDNIEKSFKENGTHLTIHMDPVIIGDKNVDKLKAKVTKTIKELDVELDIHDFRIVKGPTHTNILFDLVIPYDKEFTEKEIIKHLKNNINGEKHKYYYVVEIERPLC